MLSRLDQRVSACTYSAEDIAIVIEVSMNKEQILAFRLGGVEYLSNNTKVSRCLTTNTNPHSPTTLHRAK